MKVCDVVLNSIWFDPRVRKQVAQYQALGVEVSCVGFRCARFDEARVAALPAPAQIVSIDEKYKGKQSSVFRKLSRERQKNRAVYRAILAQKPDVIHANDFNALVPAWKAAKKRKCVLVYDAHEINSENYTHGINPLYHHYIRIHERHICRRVQQMVCVSHAAADYYAKNYKIQKPMVVTNCALASEQVFDKEKSAGFEILNHGQYYEGRGYELMIQAAPLLAEHSDIRLALRGFGRLEDALRKQAAGLSNVVFYPPVQVQELIASAASAMVGVAITQPISLNFELSVSNKLFEYAAAGLPMILSDIPEHRYLNDRYEFGIILRENTPACFAQAASRLYTDKAFYHRCAGNARRLSEEIHWEREFEKLVRTERSLCAERSR
ncbi:MAG: glycosyltransferase [Oscillospiraceae bacterium]|jgi:glycosyltransferase involved in cell wall biosynthesis|nr:glycosyltransferase [Oscillospiraceae bacterium]